VRLHYEIAGMRIGVVSEWPSAYADVTFLATARALAGEVAESDLAAGRVYPR
jgi:hypothetical protein